MLSDQGTFQYEDPAGDNYVSIRASDPIARFEPARIEFTGMHSGVQNRDAPTIIYRLVEGTLDPGESATVTYGDRSQGSRGWQAQTFNNEGVLLPLYVGLQASAALRVHMNLLLPILHANSAVYGILVPQFAKIAGGQQRRELRRFTCAVLALYGAAALMFWGLLIVISITFCCGRVVTCST